MAYMRVNEADFDDPSFDYVVELREGDKICFGSSVIRDTSPIGKGLAPHQKRITPENNISIGPGSYDIRNITSPIYIQLNKIRSKAGVGSLAGKTPRFADKVHFRTPSPGRYDVSAKKKIKEGAAPFGVQSKVREMEVDDYPGPGTYEIHKTHKCRKTRFMYNFGNPTMIHSVETVCVPIPTDTCNKCNRLCEGDYWHKEHTIFLCHICWDEEKHTRETYSESELKVFKKIRNCSFMHSHEETSAAVKTLAQNKITKKLRIENYLDLYIKC